MPVNADEGQEAAQVPPLAPAVREVFHVLQGGCVAANELFSPASVVTSIEQSISQLVNNQ